jgi:hypothetical protein
VQRNAQVAPAEHTSTVAEWHLIALFRSKRVACG